MKVHVRTPLTGSRKVWCLREIIELCYLPSTHAILLLVFFTLVFLTGIYYSKSFRLYIGGFIKKNVKGLQNK